MTQPPSANPAESARDDYQRGKAWITHLVGSVVAFKARDDDLARQRFDEADRLIGPFGLEDSPDAFRDFIAGAMRQVEVTIYPDSANFLDELIAYFNANPDLADGLDLSGIKSTPTARIYEFADIPPAN